jgi:tetratricopeptide (TPR) repeat protein
MRRAMCRWVVAVMVVWFCQAQQLVLFAAEKPFEPARPEAGATAGSPAKQTQAVESKADSFAEDIPDWQARLELARLLSYVKRYDESLAEYQKVLQEKPDLTEARLEMAAVLYWGGRPEEALSLLEQTPRELLDAPSRVLMADIYVSQKRYHLAEPIYREHLQQHPDDLAVRLKLAELLGYRKDYQQAIKEYQIILAERPDDVQVRRRYALVLSWAGRHAEAIEELRRTLDK